MQEHNALSEEMQTKLDYMVEKRINAIQEELGVSITRQPIEIDVLYEIINELEEKLHFWRENME